MRNVKFTPKGLISISLSISLLCNMTVPAFAQSRMPYPSMQQTGSITPIAQDTVIPGFDREATLNKIADSIQKESYGSLTEAQVTHIKEIQNIFSPDDPATPVQSDFEFFKQMYFKQIDAEFEREVKAQEDSRRETKQRIENNEQNYKDEIYTTIVPRAAERVLKEKSAPAEIVEEFLAAVKNFLPPLSTQLSSFANHYNNTPQADLASEISQAAQQDAALREEAINEWKAKAEANLAIYDQNIAALKKWRDEAKQKAKEVFENEYQPQLLQEREKVVRESVDTLWKYKDKGSIAHDTLLEVAPIIAPITTLDGKSFFTPEQKDWLVTQYMDTLRANHSCGDGFPKNLPCDIAIRAVSGLSMLTDSREAAEEIQEFMIARRDSAQAVPVLLVGTVALLAMKQYTVLRGFLYTSTQAENNTGNLDWLSFETIANSLANSNGHYLGEVSKYGQYPLYVDSKKQDVQNATSSKERSIARHTAKEKALGNVWEDIAQILAQEGSPEALALLREFGAERCSVYTYTKASFEKEQRLSCAGIIPFLAGALISGKSGAQQYNPLALNTQPGWVTNAHGNEYITPEKAQHNRALAQQRIQDFYQFAAEKGLTNAGMLIRHLFLQSMGDLNAESELRLDTFLYEAFQAQKQTPKEGFSITPYTRNSAEYNAKSLRQDRTQAFRIVGRVADVALLVWCVVDITKWTVSGVKIAGALSKMARMARQGISTAERANYLLHLKIAPKVIKVAHIPANVRAGSAPAMLAALPQFANETVHLPALPDVIKSAGTLTAENLTFSSKTGSLLLNYQGLLAGGLTDKQAVAIQQAVEGASTTTNVAFANGRRWSLNPNRSYRSLLRTTLDEALQDPQLAKTFQNFSNPKAADGTFVTRITHLTEADRYAILGQIDAMPIKVPGNIDTFKVPDLFAVRTSTRTSAVAPMLNQAAIQDLITAHFGQTLSAEQVANITKLMDSSLIRANIQFSKLPWWQRSSGRYKSLYLNNLTAVFDKDGQVFNSASYRNFFNVLVKAVEKDRSLVPPSAISSWRRYAVQNPQAGLVELGKAVFVNGKIPQALPLNIQVDPNVKNYRKGLYQRITFTPQAGPGNPLVNVGFDGKTIPLLKLQLNQEEVPALLQTAAQADLPLRLKVSANQPLTFSSFWENFRLTKAEKNRYFFRRRGELFTHEIPVSVRQADGSLQGTKIFLNADSHLGWRNTTAILDGKNLSLYKDGQLLRPSGLAFSLPKYQLDPFLQVLRRTPLDKPFTLTLARGKNKIMPLTWANGLSLSAASSGLIVPLENTYGDQITETDKIMISIALPYIPALLSPFISPFVLRYGALNVLKASMVFSLAGLGFAGMAGFRGYASQQSPLPPLWPLFVSGTAIGISSSLSRASLNILIDGMGGGGQLLKSMLAKNIGSVALLLPPFLANFIDKDIDFSLAFPFMSAASLSMLAWVSATRINPEIGREAGFLLRNHGLRNESLSALRLMVTREVGPLVLATTAFTGFEAAAFAKAGNQMLGPKMKETGFVNMMPESNRKNATALLTALAIQSLPLVARASAKPLTEILKSPARAGQEYRRILKMSYALNIGGGALLFANGLQSDNKALGFIGLGMMGLGTANVTQSLQKLSNLRALDSRYVLRKTAGLVKEQQAAAKKSMVTKAMTGFSSSQIGLAAVPWMVSRYTDRQIATGTEVKSQAAHDSMWIPLISIGLSAALAGPSIGILPRHIPQGLPFAAKGLIGSYPAAIKQLTSRDISVLKNPLYGLPPGFLPMPVHPIINLETIIPGKRAMETTEHSLKQATPTTDTPSSEN